MYCLNPQGSFLGSPWLAEGFARRLPGELWVFTYTTNPLRVASLCTIKEPVPGSILLHIALPQVVVPLHGPPTRGYLKRNPKGFHGVAERVEVPQVAMSLTLHVNQGLSEKEPQGVQGVAERVEVQLVAMSLMLHVNTGEIKKEPHTLPSQGRYDRATATYGDM